MRDLVGITLATELPADATDGDFENQAALQEVTLPLVNAWMLAAEEAATVVVGQLARYLPCDPSAGEDVCIRQFIQAFGRRAYRRPLAAREVDAYLTLWRNVRSVGPLPDSVGALVRAFLQSPYCIHRPELGIAPAVGDRLRLAPHEVATRLSYLLWGTMPDDELLAAADAGRLASADAVEVQVRRMLADPRGRDGVRSFFRQWLGLDRVLAATKAPASYPGWTEALRASMREEPDRFVEQVVFEGDGTLATLLAAPMSVVNDQLARHYGVAPPPAGQWMTVRFDRSVPRAGLLIQGWFLAAQAMPDQSSPTLRGLFVRQRLLCQEVPPPPPSVPLTVPPPDGRTTTRQRFMVATNEPVCQSCHQLIDRPGFSFEAFDAVGAHRVTEAGQPVDSTGELTGTDVDGPVSGAVELAQRLGRSRQVRACYQRKWFEMADGRRAVEADDCRLQDLGRAVEAAGGSLRELLVALARRDNMTSRPAAGVSGPGPIAPITVEPPDPRQVRRLVLDLVRTEVADLARRFSDPDDRIRFDQHLGALRELERALMP